MMEGPDRDEVILATSHRVAAVGAPADAGDPAEIAPHSAVEFLSLEVVDPHEAVLAGHGYVVEIRREGKSVDGSVTNGPTILERRLVFCLDSGDDGVLELCVGHKLDWSRCLPGEDGGPDVEIPTAMGGDKLSLRAWHPLDTRHPCLVYGTLQEEMYVHVEIPNNMYMHIL